MCKQLWFSPASACPVRDEKQSHISGPSPVSVRQIRRRNFQLVVEFNVLQVADRIYQSLSQSSILMSTAQFKIKVESYF